MARKYGNDYSPLKNIILITDKWNENTFAKYKRDFIHNAKEYDIWLVILLICGEELQQIPFLPNDGRRHTDVLTEFEHRALVQKKREEFQYPTDGFMFEVSPGTWNPWGGYRYSFYPDSEPPRWHREAVTGEYKDGTIPRPALEKFMRNVQKLMFDEGARLIPEHNSCDDQGYILNLFEKVIQWAYSDALNNPEFKRLQQIVDEFIQKCDKEYLKG